MRNLRVKGRSPPCPQVPDGPVTYVMYYGNGWEHYNDVEGLIIYRLLLCRPPSPPCSTVLHNVRFYNFSSPIPIMCCILHTPEGLCQEFETAGAVCSLYYTSWPKKPKESVALRTSKSLPIKHVLLSSKNLK